MEAQEEARTEERNVFRTGLLLRGQPSSLRSNVALLFISRQRQRPGGKDLSMADDLQEKLDEQLRYYRARAPEYDAWALREGGFDRGPRERAKWFADIAKLENELVKTSARTIRHSHDGRTPRSSESGLPM